MPAISFPQTGAAVNHVQIASDSDLVRRAQEGWSGGATHSALGADAVCELYDRYQPKIFRYLWSHLPDRQTAEDLTGEVFIRMVHSLPSYRLAEASFGAWLFRIARNLLFDHYRKEGHKQEISLDQVNELRSDQGDPAEFVEERLFVEKVRKGLQALQPAQQEVIVLRFMAGMPIKDVAAILGKTIGAVKIAQHRGLQELRDALGIEMSEAVDEHEC
jgi:RNA polymerase sigma-70 factor (ECF subfamily)